MLPISAFRRLLLAGPLLAAGLALPASASAAPTCNFDAAAAKLTIGMSATGDTVLRKASSGAIVVGGVTCGATVTNTDTIEATGAGGPQRLVIDLAGGQLAPGKTAEPGGSAEIEIVVDGATGNEGPSGDEVLVKGTNSVNTLRVGAAGILLTADTDADVTLTRVERAALDTLGGNDVLDGTGATVPLRLLGGAGNDQLTGGGGADHLDGGTGNDTELGGAGGDTFAQGATANGADRLDGGSSPYDRLDYSARTAGVTVDLDGVADDGAAGELDNALNTIEYVDGGAGNDSITADQVLTSRCSCAATAATTPHRRLELRLHLRRCRGGHDQGRRRRRQLYGGEGNDKLEGGDGGDIFFEDETGLPNGADDMRGGAGVDTVDAGNRAAAVTVTMWDEAANDGAAGEKDNVHNDIEAYNGSKGDDRITGNTLANRLSGGAGNDMLSGGDGNDVLEGHYGNDDLSGGNGNDEVNGGDGDDYLKGVANDDIVRGGYGDDRIDGGAGVDTVYGHQGADVFLSAAGADGADVVIGGPDHDHVSYATRTAGVAVSFDGLANDGALAGAGEGDKVLEVEEATGGVAKDTLRGSAGPDVLNGGPADDDLDGGEGDDTLDGGTGADKMVGGDGSDLADYGDRTANLIVALDDVAGDGEAGENDHADTENVRGGAGADKLVGGLQNNVLDGGAGDDELDGGPNKDRLIGGDGTDTASYASRNTSVLVDLGGAAVSGIAGEGDTIDADVENARGGSGADTLNGSDGPNALYGGPGDDRLDGKGGADVFDGEAGRDTADYSARTASLNVTLDDVADDGTWGNQMESAERDLVMPTIEIVEGSSEGDTLIGAAGNEDLRGNGGDDELEGRGGADLITGGLGTDLASYRDHAADEPVKVTIDNIADDGKPGEGDKVWLDVENLVGGHGDDELHGTTAGNVISGGPAGKDKVYGEGGDDRLDEGYDPADPAADSDELFGGEGKDVADYSKRTASLTITQDDVANDGVRIDDVTVVENDNVHIDVENVRTGSGHDIIQGNDGVNRLESGSGGDRIEARGGDDELIGGSEVDRLFGEAGKDKLTGGQGNNVLSGGDGDDRFIESTGWVGNDGYDGGAGLDTVDYTARTVRVAIDNDGVAGDDGQDTNGDGITEEKDRIGTDVEGLTGGKGNDRITSARAIKEDTCATLNGGAGDDLLLGGPGDARDVMFGGDGNDALWGGDGTDFLIGGPGSDGEHGQDGDDRFVQGGFHNGCNSYGWSDTTGSDGIDTLDGGNGVDPSTTAARDRVSVSLDGVRNDGADGELDNVLAVEDVSGGRGDDHLIGDNDANRILGSNGNDTIEGRGGDDRLWDAEGTDIIFGEGGDDEIRAKDGDRDTLWGGDGTETGEWDEIDELDSMP